MRESPQEYLYARSTPEPNCGCWFWLLSLMPYGYGVASYGGRTTLAHRFSWETFCGVIPDGFYVCHKCDVTCCVNPDHLFVGTALDNSLDMCWKGRAPESLHAIGGGNGRAVLCEDDVITIRQLRSNGEPLKSIAVRFGVSLSTISSIATGKTWTRFSAPQPRLSLPGRVTLVASSALPRHALTDNEVRMIRSLAEQGYSQRAIGAKLNTSQAHVGRIVRRQARASDHQKARET